MSVFLFASGCGDHPLLQVCNEFSNVTHQLLFLNSQGPLFSEEFPAVTGVKSLLFADSAQRTTDY